ncbi:helix-turn-helix domain-containing protein [Vibrio variabilis]|uniref:helix-turn-helix domain-containing protein n=1 Tax=Vibrio variabilis TaxID=990271 RepID=UPI000DD9A5C9|nr:helix-turn-helix domain-containing protein [Vibrio variabilis]
MRKLHSPLILTSSETLLYYIPYLESKGIRWREIASDCGLPSDDVINESWLPMKELALFLSRIAPLCEDDMPLIVGQNIAQQVIEGKWGLIESGLDFKQTIQSLMRNEHRFSRQNTYWLEKVSGVWSWCHRGLLKPSFPGSNINEWFRVSLLLHICRHWLGNDWKPASLSLMSNKNQGRIYADILLPDTEIRYEQAYFSLELTDVENLEPMANRALKSRDISEILLLAESYCHIPHFTADWVASLFGVTPKTLYRYFKDHDTSFLEIKKHAILKRSKQLLLDTDESVSNIAYRMGYDNVSNYNRAIKAMCGLTPAQLRKARTE